ncbi:MAG: transcriptional regulator [Rhizobiaceae bacterium]|nr:transcriptional regulator [Rhizobiaceae bacterium]
MKAIHGGDAEDWLLELAAFADQQGLAGAEKRIGYSRSAISNVLAGKYTGDTARVAEMVRGALMAATVECPILGEIGRDRCLQEQKEPFRATSRHRAQLFHACRGGCPFSKLTTESETP